jgi:hypothetical protein
MSTTTNSHTNKKEGRTFINSQKRRPSKTHQSHNPTATTIIQQQQQLTMEPYSTSDKSQQVKIRMGEGLASNEPMTQIQAFDNVCAKHGDQAALHQKILSPVSQLNKSRSDEFTKNNQRPLCDIIIFAY